MSDIARKKPSTAELASRDPGSSVRACAADDRGRPPQESSRSLRSDRPLSSSSIRPAVGASLDDRIEQKLRIAMALMGNLPPSDARVRLLHVAVLRRDEALLDGVLAELNKPAQHR